MNFEEALQVANAIVAARTGKPLNNTQHAVLQGAWNRQQYKEIAKSFGCTTEYLSQDVGHMLWKLLSEGLGQRVGIKNFRTVMELRLQVETVPPLPEPARAKVSDRTQNPDLSPVPPSLEQSEWDQLYKALLRLDYFKQVRLFREFVETCPVGACLIHGDPDHGQKWLLNRLMQLVPDGTTAKVIRFSLSRKARASHIQALWRELGGRVGLMGTCSPPKIVDAVYRCWQTQTVILIFHDVDDMPQSYIYEFMRDFWLPLANMAHNSSSTSRRCRLLMFLIDHSGCVEQWGMNCVDSLDIWEPHVPIKLPRLKRLSDRDLMPWIETALNELPVKLTVKIEGTVESILENSDNGLPQLVLEYICSLCDRNWYEMEQIWLKH